MTPQEKCPGLSIQLVFGKWSKPSISSMSTSLRICIGWAALSIWYCDLECMNNTIYREYMNLQDKYEKDTF